MGKMGKGRRRRRRRGRGILGKKGQGELERYGYGYGYGMDEMGDGSKHVCSLVVVVGGSSRRSSSRSVHIYGSNVHTTRRIKRYVRYVCAR